MGIEEDFKRGRSAEQYVQLLFESIGAQCEPVEKKYRPHYDLHCTLFSIDFTLEVKFDLMASKTKNVAIEYHNPVANKPSGISITKADFWVYCFTPKEVWIIPTTKLKKYIETNPPKRIIDNGGDGNASLYLYGKDALLKEFVRIDNLDNKSLLEVIKQCLAGSSESKKSPEKISSAGF